MSPSVTNRSSAGIKGLLRRGSSRSSAHPARLTRTDNEVPNPPSQSTPNLELPESSMASKPEPLYGKELCVLIICNGCEHKLNFVQNGRRGRSEIYS